MEVADDTWWRCEVEEIAHWDHDNEIVAGRSYKVRWTPYKVVRTTLRGVWVARHGFEAPSFVLGTAAKQLCVPTRALAYEDALFRANRHVSGCQTRLQRAELARAALLRNTTIAEVAL